MRLRPDAARLEADQEDGQPGRSGTRRRAPGGRASGRRGTRRRCPRRRARVAHEGEEARELREDERLVPSRRHLVERGEQRRRAWRCGSSRACSVERPGWQAAWRRRSSASSIWMRALPMPLAGDLAEEAVRGSARAARRRACAAPSSSQGSSARCLVGQLGRDLVLGAAQDERATARARGAAGVSGSGAALAPASCGAKARGGAEQPGFKNSNSDQSSPRWFSTGVPRQREAVRPREQPRRPWPTRESAFLIACASSRMT